MVTMNQIIADGLQENNKITTPEKTENMNMMVN